MGTQIKEYIENSLKAMRLAAAAAAARLCMRAFAAMYSRPWTGVVFVVHREAARLAKDGMRRWLKAHGVVHCARCLETGQMRRAAVEGTQVYLCQPCYDLGERAGALSPAVEILKP